MDKSKLLIVDYNKEILKSLEFLPAPEFDLIKTITNPNQLAFEIGRNEFDVVLLDMNYKSKNWNHTGN